ncbi:MAG: GNAT family N-acetyltransferase [Oscillospiraceae bacterium]
MDIRTAAMNDLDAIADLEAQCFPAAEAASRESFCARLEAFPDHFWLLWDGAELTACVNGMVTDTPDLTDDMYHDASLHSPNGKWQMIFGVATLPAYRRRGCAGRLLERAIADAKEQGRAGLVLTCKEKLLHYYAKFGFRDEGVSGSTHGGAVWHQMRLTFE